MKLKFRGHLSPMTDFRLLVVQVLYKYSTALISRSTVLRVVLEYDCSVHHVQYVRTHCKNN
jgi:hypothetical protein